MPTTTKKTDSVSGKIIQIVGVVIDVEFENHLPAIHNALEVTLGGKPLVLEVASHLSKNSVRAVAMGPTDGFARGLDVLDSGQPISVPVGDSTLGRIFNVTGQPIDSQAEPTGERRPIHATAPALDDQSTKTEILETGIKVIDLICPIVKGGKVGLFGGAGVGKTVFIRPHQQILVQVDVRIAEIYLFLAFLDDARNR